MKMICMLVATLLLTTTTAFAGVQGFNGSTNLGVTSKLKCSSTGGLTCSKPTLDVLQIQLATTQQDAKARTRYSFDWSPSEASYGTSTTPSATSVYLSQVRIPEAVTLTGAQLLNAATVGTDSAKAVLFNSAGTVLASSASYVTSGASSYQALPFTATVAVTPGTYWMGVYFSGTTTRFYSLPLAAARGGLAGAVTGQTFGTVANVTLPTSFVPGTGPVGFLY